MSSGAVANGWRAERERIARETVENKKKRKEKVKKRRRGREKRAKEEGRGGDIKRKRGKSCDNKGKL